MYDKLSFECPKSIKLKVFSRIDVNNCLSTSKYEWQFLRRYKSQVFARFCRSRFKQQLPCGIGQKRQYKIQHFNHRRRFNAKYPLDKLHIWYQKHI